MSVRRCRSLAVTAGVPVGGTNTGCPIDVVPCVGPGDLTLVLQASNAGSATLSTVFFGAFFAPAPAALVGLGVVAGASEPDGLADVAARWGGLLGGDPRVSFPAGLQPGETSNRFFLSFRASSAVGSAVPVLIAAPTVEIASFQIVPEPGIAWLLAAAALVGWRARWG